MSSSSRGMCAGLVFFALGIATPVEASEAKITYASGRDLQAMFVKYARIEYPWRARATSRSGRGIYRVYINPDGKVRTVGVVRSTGHTDLDLAAAAGLYHCLFKPGHKRELDLPVTFTLSTRRG